MSPQARHLYVHVPFCAHRCGYCDFVTVGNDPALHESYVQALELELQLRVDELASPLATIFIGGGTPTLLDHAPLEQLLQGLAERLEPEGELTIECNPETVTPALAALLTRSGVTRVSLGVQSFSAELLQRLERRASPEQVRRAIGTLREAGVADLSCDLIWGIPGQTLDSAQDDLLELVSLGPEHVSAYELELKPGTRMARAWAGQEQQLAEAAEPLYEMAIGTLESAGYHWYETANFARDGRYARHNLAYWHGRDFVGVGVGAVGTLAGLRRRNLPNLRKYLQSVHAGDDAPARIEELDDTTRRIERIMLAARLDEPFALTADDPVDEAEVDRLVEWELLRRDGGQVQLTRRGRLLANAVVGRLVEGALDSGSPVTGLPGTESDVHRV